MDFSSIKSRAKDTLRGIPIYAIVVLVLGGLIHSYIIVSTSKKENLDFSLRLILIMISNIQIYISLYYPHIIDEKFNPIKIVISIIADAILVLPIAIGLVLFIIPGVILMAKLSFYKTIYFTEDVTVLDALKKSWEITSGEVKDVIWFNITFVGWLILRGITLGIADVFVTPYYEISYYLYYQELLKKYKPSDNWTVEQ